MGYPNSDNSSSSPRAPPLGSLPGPPGPSGSPGPPSGQGPPFPSRCVISLRGKWYILSFTAIVVYESRASTILQNYHTNRANPNSPLPVRLRSDAYICTHPIDPPSYVSFDLLIVIGSSPMFNIDRQVTNRRDH